MGDEELASQLVSAMTADVTQLTRAEGPMPSQKPMYTRKALDQWNDEVTRAFPELSQTQAARRAARHVPQGVGAQSESALVYSESALAYEVIARVNRSVRIPGVCLGSHRLRWPGASTCQGKAFRLSGEKARSRLRWHSSCEGRKGVEVEGEVWLSDPSSDAPGVEQTKSEGRSIFP